MDTKDFVILNKEAFLQSPSYIYNNHKDFIKQCIKDHNCPDVFIELKDNISLTKTRFFQWWINKQRIVKKISVPKTKVTVKQLKNKTKNKTKEIKKINEIIEVVKVKIDKSKTVKIPSANISALDKIDIISSHEEYKDKDLKQEHKDVERKINEEKDTKEKEKLLKEKAKIEYNIQQEFIKEKIASFDNDISYIMLNQLSSVNKDKEDNLSELLRLKESILSFKKELISECDYMSSIDIESRMMYMNILSQRMNILIKLNQQELEIIREVAKARSAPVHRVKSILDTITYRSPSSDELQRMKVAEPEKELSPEDQKMLDEIFQECNLKD